MRIADMNWMQVAYHGFRRIALVLLHRSADRSVLPQRESATQGPATRLHFLRPLHLQVLEHKHCVPWSPGHPFLGGDTSKVIGAPTVKTHKGLVLLPGLKRPGSRA